VKALAIAPLLLAIPLAAQAPLGTWSLASSPDLPAIIEAATAKMNFVTRPIARGRLKKTNTAYQRIRIERTAAEFAFTYDDRQPQRMPADGKAVDWKREDGEKFLISTRTDKDDLVQTYKAEDGERTNVFHVDPATHVLSLTVTVKSAKLPAPVVYTLTYKTAS
jgi:hypothetical protein